MRIAILIISLAISSQVIACGDFDLGTSLKKAPEFRKVPDKILQAAIEGGKWNKWKSAFSLCYKAGSSKCFLVIFGAGDPYVSDLSLIEQVNLEKLGSNGASYEKIDTTISKWLYTNDKFFQVELETVAYKNGQTFTASEPVLVKKNGRIVYR